MKKRQSGFTLIELLVVIGILAVLLAIVLIAINPARQFAQANNAKRSSDVNAILNAIHQYGADNRGNLTALGLPAAGADPVIITDVNVPGLCAALVPMYMAALPVDPLTNNGDPIEPAECGAAYSTNYTVAQGANGRITIAAPATELGIPVISVLR